MNRNGSFLRRMEGKLIFYNHWELKNNWQTLKGYEENISLVNDVITQSSYPSQQNGLTALFSSSLRKYDPVGTKLKRALM